MEKKLKILTEEEILESLLNDPVEIDEEFSQKYNRFRKIARDYAKLNEGKDYFKVIPNDPESKDTADMFTKILNHKFKDV